MNSAATDITSLKTRLSHKKDHTLNRFNTKLRHEQARLASYTEQAIQNLEKKQAELNKKFIKKIEADYHKHIATEFFENAIQCAEIITKYDKEKGSALLRKALIKRFNQVASNPTNGHVILLDDRLMTLQDLAIRIYNFECNTGIDDAANGIQTLKMVYSYFCNAGRREDAESLAGLMRQTNNNDINTFLDDNLLSPKKSLLSRFFRK